MGGLFVEHMMTGMYMHCSLFSFIRTRLTVICQIEDAALLGLIFETSKKT